MEVERNVKALPEDGSEAAWSLGPRTTTSIPPFSDEELRSLARHSREQRYGDFDIEEVLSNIDDLFGELPEPDAEGTEQVTVVTADRTGWRESARLKVRKAGEVAGKLKPGSKSE